MHRIHPFFFVATFLAVGTPAAAQHGPPVDLPALSRGAERVVVATVTHIEPVFQTNEFGDQLIVSRTHVRIDAVLKHGGKSNEKTAVVEVEGGTIGDLKLEVSDLPSLERGERAILFLRPDSRGALVPHGRGQGIMKLDSSDRVRGSGWTVSAVRQAVESAR